MDSVLSVLVTTISAMDIIEVLMYFAAHLRGDTLQTPSGTDDLETLKSNIKETIAQTPVPENSFLTCAQDGTLYRDQYRIDTDIDAQKLDEIDRRVDDLANRVKNSEDNNNNVDSGSSSVSKSNIENNGKVAGIDDENERTSDQNNNNLTCLTDKNNNDALKVQKENLACDANTTTTKTENEIMVLGMQKSTPSIDVQLDSPSQMLIENEKRDANETSLDSCYESLGSDATTAVAPPVIDSSRLRPLTREDEFRHTIRKRSSVSSTSSQESRVEELQVLTNMEQEEQQHIDDFMPIIYPGSPLIDVLADCLETDNEPELETIIEVHSSSPDEPTAEEEAIAKRYALDKSPVPNIGVQMSLPWGDVKQEKENKSKDLFSLAKSASIEEVDVEERVDAAKETKKWVENLEADVIKEEFETKEEEEMQDEPVLTVIRKKSLKSGREMTKEARVSEHEPEHVTEIFQNTETENVEGPKQVPVDEPVVIQKRINLIGIKPNTDSNNNEVGL